MSRSYPARALLVVPLAALRLGIGTDPLPASATDPLTISYASCAAQHATVECAGRASGGSGGNAFTWSPTPSSVYNAFDSSTAVTHCVTGISYTLTLTVRDSSGATASKSFGRPCSEAHP